MLHGRVIRHTTGITEWKILEQEPRHTALLDNVASRSNHYRRNAARFQMPCRQTDGLVTNRSQRDQDHHVDGVFLAKPKHFGCHYFTSTALTVIGRYAVVPRRQSIDAPLVGEVANGLQW